ncbi:hypothetical protein AERO9A_420020 [Aeromonas salmonicida]|nr:hypothetical protein AERO9A_420020 [Aeromonas salmonicida]
MTQDEPWLMRVDSCATLGVCWSECDQSVVTESVLLKSTIRMACWNLGSNCLGNIFGV